MKIFSVTTWQLGKSYADISVLYDSQQVTYAYAKIPPQHTAMLQAHIQKYLKYVNACSWKSHKNMLTQSYKNNYHIYPNTTWEFFPQSLSRYLVWLSMYATQYTFCVHTSLKTVDYEETYILYLSKYSTYLHKYDTVQYKLNLILVIRMVKSLLKKYKSAQKEGLNTTKY